MILKGIEVDTESEMYKKVQELCANIEVKFGRDINIKFPMQKVETGCGSDDCNALRLSVNYRKAGRSFYDGHSYPSSYFLNVTPVELVPTGYRCLMFGGFNATIAEVSRNTEKQRGLAVKALQDELVDVVYKSLAHFKVKL